MTTRMIRNVIIGAAALALPLVAVASPAGASTSQHVKTEMANYVRKNAPQMRPFTTRAIVNMGALVCVSLTAMDWSSAQIEVHLEGDKQLGRSGHNLTYKSVNAIFSAAVTYQCPTQANKMWGYVVASNPGLASLGKAAVVNYAYNDAASSLANGETPGEVQELLVNQGLSSYDATTVITAATYYLAPQYENEVAAWYEAGTGSGDPFSS